MSARTSRLSDRSAVPKWQNHHAFADDSKNPTPVPLRASRWRDGSLRFGRGRATAPNLPVFARELTSKAAKLTLNAARINVSSFAEP